MIEMNAAKSQMSDMYHSFIKAKQDIKELAAIDYFFAKEMLLALSVPVEQQKLMQGIFFSLSASLRAGHTCLALADIANSQWGDNASKNLSETTDETITSIISTDINKENSAVIKNEVRGFIFPELSVLNTLLLNLSISEGDCQPVVFKSEKLYLRRYFQFESELTEFINQRLQANGSFKIEKIQQVVEHLFPSESTNDSKNEEIDWQKIAVANAINKNFSVIAGGPGTGKTYTVTKLLAALVMLNLDATEHENSCMQASNVLNIALVAPTGKAAQRLSESIVNAVTGFKGQVADNVLQAIPCNAQTIHRLLGVIPNKPNFRHHSKNLLPFDIVLIDEVSMVDLPLMTRIFRALKPDAKVILLGDADQLPSVAVGSVLADIAPRPHGGYSDNNLVYLSQICRLPEAVLQQGFSVNAPIMAPTITSNMAPAMPLNKADYLTFLVKSRRFDGQGGIGLLANAVIAGNAHASWQLLTDTTQKSTTTSNDKQQKTSQLVLATTTLNAWLTPLVKQYYQPIEQCEDIHAAFTLLASFRVLCATRQGDYGVESLNDKIKTMLGKRKLGQSKTNAQSSVTGLYHGQPIMISENDYALGLYNGDTGIIWRVKTADDGDHLVAVFQQESSVRQILPSRLPKFETVYAMTIHKTQGSEFNHVAMAISPPDAALYQSKLLSRELLYTGITRAKNMLTIASHQKTWMQGVNTQVKRNSGLVVATNS